MIIAMNTPRRIPGLFFVLLGASLSAGAAETSDPYAQLPSYKVEQPRTVLAAIETEIQTAQPAQLPAIEAKLLAVLQSPAATKDAKGWVCRQLRQVGTARAAPALTPLLADEDLATMARWALQSIPGATVDEALRGAVGKLAGRLQAGVIQTLGARRDRQAVPVLAPLASSTDATVADAALFALGQIGGAAALQAVEQAQPPASLAAYRFHALLLCAESLRAEGQSAQAAKTYQKVLQQAGTPILRSGALGGLLAADKAQGAAAIQVALRSDQGKLRLAAAKLVCERGDAELLKAVLAQLSALRADVQLTLIAHSNDRVALPAVLKAAKIDDAEVRSVALEALGRLGDAACVPLLLEAAAGDGAPRTAARKSLLALAGVEVDAALLALAKRGPSPLRVEALRTLAGRAVASAEPTFVDAAKDADNSVRAEAFAALGALGQATTLPTLVGLLAAAPTDADRAAAEKALAAVCRRLDDKPAAAEPLLAALAGANPAVRCVLLRVAAGLPTPKTLAALRAAINDADPAVEDAAVRGLAAWPDAAAQEDLRRLAASATKKAHQVLALRGFVRLATQSDANPQATAKLLEQALKLAQRADDKKLVLAALGDVSHPTALDLAMGCMADKDLEVETATALVRIAKSLRGKQAQSVDATIRKALAGCKSAEARQVIQGAFTFLDDMVNIAPTGKASCPDGLKKDGNAGDDQAGIDGNPATYWDKEDHQPLYRYVVAFTQPEAIAAISVMGYGHHKFAPKDFEILGDGKLIKKVTGARYDNNLLVVRFAPLTCKSLELKITGYYGGSPAIRELGIYRPAAKKDAAK